MMLISIKNTEIPSRKAGLVFDRKVNKITWITQYIIESLKSSLKSPVSSDKMTRFHRMKMLFGPCFGRFCRFRAFLFLPLQK